ncbi:unnamed protein product, partial [Allacma fusca]
GPIFRHRPKSVQADLGANVGMSCDVDGNPTPEIVWMQEKTLKDGSSTKQIQLYRCQPLTDHNEERDSCLHCSAHRQSYKLMIPN